LTSLVLELEICEGDHRSKNLVSFDDDCNARIRLHGGTFFADSFEKQNTMVEASLAG
jgi:hypothetical protein